VDAGFSTQVAQKGIGAHSSGLNELFLGA
jgi:hypothetical protein